MNGYIISSPTHDERLNAYTMIEAIQQSHLYNASQILIGCVRMKELFAKDALGVFRQDNSPLDTAVLGYKENIPMVRLEAPSTLPGHELKLAEVIVTPTHDINIYEGEQSKPLRRIFAHETIQPGDFVGQNPNQLSPVPHETCMIPMPAECYGSYWTARP